MLLKSVDIQGFKTFPDKTKLKFEEKLLAVVGPNGSGKSNVSDAIRWVLGEQSARVLRCNKMEDVVFKGTTTRKAKGFAEVTMNIDNTDRSINFDSDDVSITRRYFRSGESEYLINKVSVRLKDINELFMDTGLGRDGYSIIGQGKIDAIVSAKSEERREIFEEASGISRFRYRKEESERRLKRTEENLVRLHDILSEIENRVEPLRIQSEKATKFIEYDKEKTRLEIGLWVNTLNVSGKILREHSEKTAVAQSHYDKTLQELDKINTDNNEIILKISETNANIENFRSKAVSSDEESIRKSADISVLENDILHSTQNRDRVEQEIENVSNDDKNAHDEIVQKKAELSKINEQIMVQGAKYIEFSNSLEDARKGADGLVSKIDDIEAQRIKANTFVQTEKIRVASYQSSLDENEARLEDIRNNFRENLEYESNLITEKNELNTYVNEMNAKIISLGNSHGGYMLRLKKREEKAEQMKAYIDNQGLNISEQNRKAKLLEELDKNLEGFAFSVKRIVGDAQKGILSGIHGPVSKLINVPSDYALAIETAMGASMQNIVVDTENDAKTAIQHLKRNSAGRATFLPLSNIKGSVMNANDIKNIDGFIGIASELVECDAKYNNIKNSILGRTVITDDLNTATFIARKLSYKFRVVSIDGQVVNAGGSLTGGAKNKNSGILSRSVEIAKIREFANKMQSELEEKFQAYKEYKEKLNLEHAEIELILAEKNTAEQDLIRAKTELNSVQKDLENQKNNLFKLNTEKENIKIKIAETENNITKSNNEIAENEKILFELIIKTQNLSGNKSEHQKVLEDIGEKMQEIRLVSLTLQKDKEVLENSISILDEKKHNSAVILSRLKTELLELEAIIQNSQNQIEIICKEVDILNQTAENSREQVRELAVKRDEFELKITKLRDSERACLSERENISKELARLTERSQNLQKEYDTIIAKLWEEYELTRREAEEQAVVIEDVNTAKITLNSLKSKIRSLGTVNLSAIEEYIEVSERFEFLNTQISDVEKSKNELLKLINELTKHMQDQFSVRFKQIADNFTEIFKELFGGGTAILSFTDENDILNSGIDIKVHPPGKIVSHIEALSGGEKALVAISIYFAIMKVSPPPFCMLDEVEAALDDVNVRRFAEYLTRMTDKTQFIVITHRRGTMETADMLYGVTMQEDGVSKLLVLKTQEEKDKLQLN